MSIITITPDEALRKEFIEKTIITKMNPDLYFAEAFPVVDLKGASTFRYFTDDTSAKDDITAGVMGTPLTMSELGKLSKVKVSPMQKRVGDTYEFGYKLEFSRKVVREQGFIDEITRAYDRAAYGMRQKINTDVLAAMSASAASPTANLSDGVWATSTGISKDIIAMQEAFDQEGWDFELTDIYANKAQYYQAKQYYRATETGPWNDRDVEGLKLNNAKSNIPAGTIYGLDMNLKPITLYKNTDAEFSSDPTNSMIMVDKYQQKEYPKKIIIEIWSEMGIGVKYGKAILKQPGLA